MDYGTCWTYPKGKINKMVKTVDDKVKAVLPAYTAEDAGKVLKVKSDGTLEWATDATE